MCIAEPCRSRYTKSAFRWKCFNKQISLETLLLFENLLLFFCPFIIPSSNKTQSKHTVLIFIAQQLEADIMNKGGIKTVVISVFKLLTFVSLVLSFLHLDSNKRLRRCLPETKAILTAAVKACLH